MEPEENEGHSGHNKVSPAEDEEMERPVSSRQRPGSASNQADNPPTQVEDETRPVSTKSRRPRTSKREAKNHQVEDKPRVEDEPRAASSHVRQRPVTANRQVDSPPPQVVYHNPTHDMEEGKAGKVKDTKYGYQEDEDDQGLGGCGKCCVVLSWILIVLTFPFSLCVSIKMVQEYERAVIFRVGRLKSKRAVGPGIFFILPCTDKYVKVDKRTITFDVPPQEILTKDSVTVAVDAVVYYRIDNPTIAITNVENVDLSTRLLAATTLRNVLGTKTLADILAERDAISRYMQESLDEATDPWGVKVERVEIKDARLPQQLQRAMAAEAEATREARAKVIAAEGEAKASRALREAADVINESPAALQLRYLQTLNSISAEKNSTIIFPLPIELLRGFNMK